MTKTTRDSKPAPEPERPLDQTEPIPVTEPGATHPDGHPGPDPSNAPVERLVAPLDDDDDVHDRLRLVNTEDDGAPGR